MVRIQLANNFQVVEITGETFSAITRQEIEEAIDLVNELAGRVDVQTKPATTKNNKADTSSKRTPSSSQINYAVGLGLDRSKAENMTKKELWEYINNHKE